MVRLLLYLLVISSLSCNTTPKSLELNQNRSREKLVLRFDSISGNLIMDLAVPIEIKLKNNLREDISFSSIDYWDSYYRSYISSILYERKDSTLIRVSTSKHKLLGYRKEKSYTLFIQKLIIDEKVKDSLYDKFIKGGLQNKSIKMDWGNGFRLIERMTNKDSIYVRVYNDDKLQIYSYPVIIK